MTREELAAALRERGDEDSEEGETDRESSVASERYAHVHTA